MRVATIKNLIFILGIIIFITLTAYFGFARFYPINISYNSFPEVGDEIIVRFPSWVSEETAKKSFSVKPPIDGALVWLPKYNELHFLPNKGFNPIVEYEVTVKYRLPLFAALTPYYKTLKFQTTTISISNKPTQVYTPVITEGKYIDANLETMTLTLFENGNAVKTYPIARKGNPQTSPTPQKQFKILAKRGKIFSNYSHVWMPWSMQISGPYYIHEWPYWPGGAKVASEYSSGCISLNEGNAQEVYEWAEIGTPVIIHSTPGIAGLIPPENIQDGDLIREVSDYRVYIIKIVGEKRFKRHVLTEEMEKWYPHLYPFKNKIKIAPNGALANYSTSRWVRLQRRDNSSKWDIYEIDDEGKKHLITCQGCGDYWNVFGWNRDEIYTTNEKELDYYTTGPDLNLIPSALISK